MNKTGDLRVCFEPFNDAPKQFVINGVRQPQHRRHRPVRLLRRTVLSARADDEVLGGLLGQVWGEWLHIKIVWVAPAARGQGHAAAMVRAAEDYAKKRGARGAFLETFSFQASALRKARLRGIRPDRRLPAGPHAVLFEEDALRASLLNQILRHGRA